MFPGERDAEQGETYLQKRLTRQPRTKAPSSSRVSRLASPLHSVPVELPGPLVRELRVGWTEPGWWPGGPRAGRCQALCSRHRKGVFPFSDFITWKVEEKGRLTIYGIFKKQAFHQIGILTLQN